MDLENILRELLRDMVDGRAYASCHESMQSKLVEMAKLLDWRISFGFADGHWLVVCVKRN